MSMHMGRSCRSRIIALAGTVGLAIAGVCFTASPAQASWAYAYFNIVARHSGKCVDVAGVGYADGANVHQWTCLGLGQQNQQWRMVPVSLGYIRLMVAHSGKCLDVAGVSTATGANIHQWDCLPNQYNQWWSFQ